MHSMGRFQSSFTRHLHEIELFYTYATTHLSRGHTARVSDQTAFMLRESMEDPAKLIEVGETRMMFTNPSDKRTEAYITGRFG